jgi:hypothetical protein
VALLRAFGVVTAHSPCKNFVFATALRLECSLAILEAVLHFAGQHTAAGRWQKAKALLESEEAGLASTVGLEMDLALKLSVKEKVLAAAAGRVPGRASAMVEVFQKHIKVCEGALALEKGDDFRAETAAQARGLSLEELVEREQMAAEDYKCFSILSQEAGDSHNAWRAGSRCIALRVTTRTQRGHSSSVLLDITTTSPNTRPVRAWPHLFLNRANMHWYPHRALESYVCAGWKRRCRSSRT